MAAAATLLSAGLDGLLHPLTAPAHIIAVTGVALMAGRRPRRIKSAWGVISVFALGLAVGLGALAAGIGETPAPAMLLAIAVLCGLTAASGVPAPVALVAPAALASGVAAGLDSPPDAIRFSEAVAAMTGAGCSSVALLALASIAASAVARWRDGIALRVAGSWIAAIAIMALAVQWTA